MILMLKKISDFGLENKRAEQALVGGGGVEVAQTM
jgi:hypothetical protein